MAAAPRHAGFTLVELLVVVTIIVILLALLAPALGKAIYQGRLVQCAGNQKVVTSAVITYAMENRRWYPERGLPEGESPSYINPMAIVVPTQPGYDLRPMLRDKLGLNVNRNTQCALVEPVDLENSDPDENLAGNQALWWGWKLAPLVYLVNTNVGGSNVRVSGGVNNYSGMYRLGDAWSAPIWNGVEMIDTPFHVLVSDFDRAGGTQGSHPDDANKMYNYPAKGVVGFGFRITISYWQAPTGVWPPRGRIDMNFGYDDGSVRRYDGVQISDPRMADAPQERNNRYVTMQVPPG
jgi:prepilin-type N-terminal cleavage/methylation domain-containing protein